jgi:cellulose biosynthesis protein BcsQ
VDTLIAGFSRPALSSGLARAGKRTLLVDLDPQGHSTIGNDIDLGPNDLTLRDHLTEPGKPHCVSM